MSQPTTTETHELSPQPPAQSPSSTQHAEHPPNIHPAQGGLTTHSLPPYDGGFAAWRLLAVAFVFEALLWGFPLSFGVFQEYYSRLPQFKNDPFIGVVGTVASGMSYIAAPVSIPLIRRYARYRRHMIWFGWPLCLLGLVAGSFAKSLGALVVTQGAMYGVGFIVFYYPIIGMINEYWIARRGMAYGIMCGASGVSGAVMPFALQALLERYGYPTTLRVIAVGLCVITGPLIPFLKGRLPEPEVSAAGRTDWSFLRTPLFWIYSASNLAMGLGYFFPSLYLPSYAVSNGLSATQGAVLLAIMSVSQVLGQFSFGYASDRRVGIDVLMVTSTLVAAIVVYTCWGFSHSFGLMIFFALVYGFFGAGYTALWGRMGTAISTEPTAAFSAFGLLNLGKGVGNVLAGPIGGALVGGRGDNGAYGALRYEKLMLFTGSCMLVSGAIVVSCRLKHFKLSPGLH